MTCIGTILRLQQRNNGKTTRMICDAIKSAIENPDKRIILCVPHIESLPELPSNITLVQTNNITNIGEYVTGRSLEVIFIDHNIKDNTIIDQARYINKLSEELAAHQRKLEQVKEILGL